MPPLPDGLSRLRRTAATSAAGPPTGACRSASARAWSATGAVPGSAGPSPTTTSHGTAATGSTRRTSPSAATAAHRAPLRGTGKWYTVLPIVEQDLLEYRERVTQATYDMLFHVPPRSSRKPH